MASDPHAPCSEMGRTTGPSGSSWCPLSPAFPSLPKGRWCPAGDSWASPVARRCSHGQWTLVSPALKAAGRGTSALPLPFLLGFWEWSSSPALKAKQLCRAEMEPSKQPSSLLQGRREGGTMKSGPTTGVYHGLCSPRLPHILPLSENRGQPVPPSDESLLLAASPASRARRATGAPGQQRGRR